jgi:cellulose synthase/poly-beta-1,6-N-acetylglucosamine synthase-like glycosyltransferase
MKLPAALLSLFAIILLPMLQQEFMNACPRMARGLVRVAARLIPPAHRGRYLDEWLAELDELEGLQLTMLATAARILLFAPTTGWALRGGPQPAPTPTPSGGSRPKPAQRRARALRRRDSRVLVVLVTSNSRPFLREAFRGLAKQTRPIDDVVIVDFGSTDGGAEWAASRLGEDAVIAVEGKANRSVSGRLGQAVAAVLRDQARMSDVDWLWLVHADTVPDPDTLEQLLLEVGSRQSVHVAGPKVVDGSAPMNSIEPRRLLEVGWSVDRTGRPVPRVDEDEVDQGQRDKVADVFFVSTAGMLVRLDALQAVGGFDRRLAGGLEGLDLC